MIRATAPAGAELTNPGLSDMCIYANNLAGVGLLKQGVASGQFKRLVISNATSIGISEGINSSSPITTDELSVFEDIQVICQTGTTCWKTTGNNTYDLAHQTYKNINIQHHGTAIGFDCGASDKNDFIDLTIQSVTGSGYSFIAEAGTSNNPAPNACNEHHFSGVTTMEGGMHVVANGAYSSWGNSIDQYALGETEPQPTVDSGASLSWTDDKGQIHNILQGVGYGAGGLALGSAPTFEATLEVGQCVEFATCAKFGPSLPLYLENAQPTVSFNAFWDGTGNYFGDGSIGAYAGQISLQTTTGTFNFATTATPGNAGAAATIATVATLDKSGNFNTASLTASSKIVGASVRSGTVSNSDLTGRVTLSGGTFTFTLLGTYATAPNCLVQDVTTPANAAYVVESTTQLVFHGTGTDVIKYECNGLN